MKPMPEMSDRQVIAQWGLSPEVEEKIVNQYPEVIPTLVSYRGQPAFDPQAEIKSYSCLIEGVTIINYERGKKTYYLPCPPDYAGDYSEYYLNGELVLMEFLGEIVVDRLSAALKSKVSELVIRVTKKDGTN